MQNKIKQDFRCVEEGVCRCIFYIQYNNEIITIIYQNKDTSEYNHKEYDPIKVVLSP